MASSSASPSPARWSTIPSALLLDEPLGALDLKLRQAMQLELKRIQREVGITFVYVTHDQEEALTMSDRIAVMNDGEVEQIASPEEIYSSPASVFVASFIGVANLLPATVDAVRDGEADVTLPGGTKAPVPVGHNDPEPHHRATVMVRPERLGLRVDEPVNGAPHVATTVTDLTFQGPLVRAALRTRPTARRSWRTSVPRTTCPRCGRVKRSG